MYTSCVFFGGPTGCVYIILYTPRLMRKLGFLSLSDNLNIIMRYVRRRHRKPQYISETTEKCEPVQRCFMLEN